MADHVVVGLDLELFRILGKVLQLRLNDIDLLVVDNLTHFVYFGMECFIYACPFLHVQSRLRKSILFIILPIRASPDEAVVYVFLLER